jgi:hypothetical protein
MYRRSNAKRMGTCCQCGRDIWGPPFARYIGVSKTPCKKYCGGVTRDATEESERRYFEKFSAEYQMEVQGYVSSI